MRYPGQTEVRKKRLKGFQGSSIIALPGVSAGKLKLERLASRPCGHKSHRVHS